MISLWVSSKNCLPQNAAVLFWGIWESRYRDLKSCLREPDNMCLRPQVLFYNTRVKKNPWEISFKSKWEVFDSPCWKHSINWVLQFPKGDQTKTDPKLGPSSAPQPSPPRLRYQQVPSQEPLDTTNTQVNSLPDLVPSIQTFSQTQTSNHPGLKKLKNVKTHKNTSMSSHQAQNNRSSLREWMIINYY